MLQKSVCAVFFYFRYSAALDNRSIIDPRKDALEQMVNQAEMSEGGQ